MKILFATCLTLLYINISTSVELNYKSQQSPAPLFVSPSGAPVDEVVVESSLYIKPKQKLILRRSRSEPSLIKNLLKSTTQKKKLYRPQSQSAANAAANNFYNNPNERGAFAANAPAQAFHSQRDSNSFGVSSGGTQAQILNRNGFQGAAGGSLAQTYILLNGQTPKYK